MKKNKYLLFLFVALFLINFSAAIALEQPLKGLNGKESLPEYVKFLFGFIVGLGVVVASVSFAVGAVGLILASVSANAEGAKNAKDRMFGALLGLVLTVSSYIILQTINPVLLTPTLNPLPPVVLQPPSILPGVYYYTEPGCEGEASGPHTSNDDRIADPFYRKISSVKLVADTAINYGIIFHQQNSRGAGYCTTPIIGGGCMPVNNPENTSSADIFSRSLAQAAGDGVSFFSEPHGWDSGISTIAGKITIPDEEMIFDFYQRVGIYQIPANKMEYDWTDATNAFPESKNIYKTFKDAPGSIQINGTYLVGLYSKDPKDRDNPNKLYCQTFIKNAPNLNAEPIVAAGGETIETVYIIPTK